MLVVSLIALAAWTWVLSMRILDAEWWAWALWIATALCVLAFTIDSHISIMRREEQHDHRVA
jgi:hypothetical protein